MRFISFSILFAVFAILFHGVAANANAANANTANANAANANTANANTANANVSQRRPSPSKHQDAANTLRKSRDAQERARNSQGEEKAKYEQLAKKHKEAAHALLKDQGKKEDPATHLKRAQNNLACQKKHLENAKNAKTVKERQYWNNRAKSSATWAELHQSLASQHYE